MLTEKSSVILQMRLDACVWAVHVAVRVSGGVSSSGVSVVFICSLFRVLVLVEEMKTFYSSKHHKIDVYWYL